MFKNVKISTQLIVNFIVMIIFVVALGLFSSIQTNRLNDQIETMYKHPLQIRRAISRLELDVSLMRIEIDNILISETSAKKTIAKQAIEKYRNDVSNQFKILESFYLGPKSDLEKTSNAYIDWMTYQDTIIDKDISINEIVEVERLLNDGISKKLLEELLESILTIDNFAISKADELYLNAGQLSIDLKFQLMVIILILTTLTGLVSIYLIRNIKSPLKQFVSKTQKFKNGDMSVRLNYVYKNEFGALSTAINELIESIQSSRLLNKHTTEISDVMLSEDDAERFFINTMKKISNIIDANVGAVYLLNHEQTSYELFSSIGLSVDKKQSFSLEEFEGEFGWLEQDEKFLHLKNIEDESHMNYATFLGEVIPKEVISIPINNSGRIVGVLSFASIYHFDQMALNVIESIYDTISARVEGILAFREIKRFSELLERQNTELDQQKTELAAQTKALMYQNRELEVQKSKLRQASVLKTNFLSNMSHELRTPLNSVIALSGVLSRKLNGSISEKEHSYLEVIERNGKKLLLLINDILDISRIEAGKEEFEITHFDVNEVIKDIVEMIQPQMENKAFSLKQQSNVTPFFISSDERKLSHIIQNLVSNAIKFTENGWVIIRSDYLDDHVVIDVIDTGIGISDDQMNHIFDEFRQADGSTSRRYGGTGLGLAIAKKYTSILGGHLEVKSSINQGSVFTIKLPIERLDVTQIMAEQVTENKEEIGMNESLQIKSFDKTILLIEDSEPAIVQVKELIEEIGYKVVVAQNGQLGLDLLETFTPDACIIDLMMPIVDGFHVIQSIRENEKTKRLPLMVLSAKQVSKDDYDFLMKTHVFKLVQKGDFSRFELQKSITKMLFPTNDVTNHLNLVKKTQILVVEDNEDNMITVNAILASHYDILEAQDGLSAIAMARKHVPTLILMDLSLPDIDGIEVFNRIREIENLKKIPILALTATAMDQDRKIILAHGFDGFITKPIITNDFLKAIRGVLNDDKS